MRTGDAEGRTATTASPDLEGLFADLERLVVTDPAGTAVTGEAALADVNRHGTTGDRLRLHRMLAMAYAHTNQFSRALDICQAAAALPDSEGEPVEVARIELASMQPLANLDRVDEAIAAGRHALETLGAHCRDDLAGRAALNIGAIYAMTGHPAEALTYFDQARAHLRDEPVLLGQLETNRGTAFAALDRFREAEDAFARASLPLNTGEMSWAAAIAEGNLADLAARQGAISRSLRHFEASRRFLEQDGAFGDLGRLNAEEAAVLAASGLTELAREAFAGAVAMLAEHGAATDLASAEIAYGAALVDAGELDAAASVLRETGGRIDDLEHLQLGPQLLMLRARLMLAREEFDDSAGIIGKGMQEAAGKPIQHLRWLILQADLRLARAERGDAETLLHAALKTAADYRITPLIADIHQRLAGIARETGNRSLADRHAREAIDAFERIRGTIQADRLRQSYHHGRLRVYQDHFLSLLDRDDATSQAEALQVAERIRGRMLLDAMQARGNDVERAGPAPAGEEMLVQELADHRRWLNWTYSALADGAELSAGQLRELDERERLASQLADRLAVLRPQPGFVSPGGYQDIQQELSDDTIALSYLMVDNQLTLQVLAYDHIQGYTELAGTVEVAERVAAMQFQIGRALAYGSAPGSAAREARLRRDMDAELSQLYDLLIAPVELLLQSRQRLVIVPSGDLHSVPFAALLGDGAYLADRLEVMTAPGLGVLAGISERPRSGQFQRPLVCGVPDQLAPGLGEEARFVAQRFQDVTLLLGEAATREAVLGAIESADLAHFACHGRFDSLHPSASGIQLADGWLTLDRLIDIRLDGALVLLTGCETGRVRVDRGDDLVGIVAASIAAGASGLVSSLWKTRDDAATALAGSFYDALGRGMDVAGALRASQREVREAFDHPAYWAPFVGLQALRKGRTS